MHFFPIVSVRQASSMLDLVPSSPFTASEWLYPGTRGFTCLFVHECVRDANTLIRKYGGTREVGSGGVDAVPCVECEREAAAVVAEEEEEEKEEEAETAPGSGFTFGSLFTSSYCRGTTSRRGGIPAPAAAGPLEVGVDSALDRVDAAAVTATEAAPDVVVADSPEET